MKNKIMLNRVIAIVVSMIMLLNVTPCYAEGDTEGGTDNDYYAQYSGSTTASYGLLH